MSVNTNINSIVNNRRGGGVNVELIKINLLTEIKEVVSWDNDIDACWIHIGENPLVDLKSSKSASVVGDVIYNEKKGYGSNGSSYLNYNFTPLTDAINYKHKDGGFTIYTPDAYKSKNSFFGCYDGSNYTFITPYSGLDGRCYNSVNSGVEFYDGNKEAGCYTVVRNDNIINTYVNGVLAGSDSVEEGSIISKSLYGLGVNNNSSSVVIANDDRLSVTIIHSKLTETKIINLHKAINKAFDKLSAKNIDLFNTDDFSYKKIGESILFKKDSYIFKVDFNAIYYSNNNGITYKEQAFPDSKRVSMAHIFSTGECFFGTRTKLYYSDDGLNTYSEVTLKDSSGNDYVVHTPVNSSYPGAYFTIISQIKRTFVNDVEIAVFGNYTNYNQGASPVNIYSLKSDGSALVAYQFGQNPYHKDNGTRDGGTTGTLLGDSSNNVIARHVHSFCQDNDTGKFYVCTGDDDHNGSSELECHWLEGVYDDLSNTWSWNVIISASNATRYKSVGLNYYNGYIYFGSDSTGSTIERGIYKCLPSDIASSENHVKLFKPDSILVDLLVDNGMAIGTAYAESSTINRFHYSNDLTTWKSGNLSNITGDLWLGAIHYIDNNGFFTINASAPHEYYLNNTVYIKIK